MAKLWAVIKREYLERVRTKWFIISTIFGPILLSAIMVLPAIMTARSIRDATVGKIEIVDVTGLGLGTRSAARIVGPMANVLTMQPRPPTEVHGGLRHRPRSAPFATSSAVKVAHQRASAMASARARASG